MSAKQRPLNTRGVLSDAAASPQWPPAPELPGYRILESIGEGASGVVFKAHHEGLDRTVAIKVLSISDEPDLDARLQRFHREARLMARVVHPHVVTVYDAGRWNGHAYLVTEYLAGGNLRALMRPVRGGAMDTDADRTHCAASQYSCPTYRCRTWGFRVACSHSGGAAVRP